MAGSTTTDDLSYATAAAGAKLEQTSAWLDQLLRPATGTGSALANGLGYLNLAALVVVVGLLLIQLLRDVNESADSGEVPKSAGLRPLRWVVAIAATVPISGGLSGLQLLILWVAALGSSIGTFVWKGVAGAVLAGGATIVSSPPPTTDFEMINSLVRASACAEIYNTKSIQGGTGVALKSYQNQRFADTRPAPPPPLPVTDAMGNPVPSMAVDPPTINQVFGFAPALDGIPSGVCGGLSYVAPVTPLGTANRPMSASALIDPSKNPYLAALQSKAQALATVAPDAEKLGQTLAQGLVGGAQSPPDGGAAALRAIYEKYSAAVRQPFAAALAVANTSDEARRMSAAVPSSNWTAAGSWYLDLATISALVAKAATVEFDIDPPVIGAWGYASSQSKIEGQQKLEAIDAALTNFAKQAGAATQASKTSDYAAFNSITRALTPALNIYDGTEKSQLQGALDANPLASLNNYGWGLVTVGGSALGLSAAASAVPGVGKILSSVTPLAWICLFAGLLLAIWVPLRPFIEFLFGIFGWLTEIVIAVIGSCVLLIGLIRGDDVEILGRAADKVLAVLISILLRPALMVMFLTVSVGIFTIFVGFVSWSIGPVVASLVEGGGVIGTIVATIATPVLLSVVFVVGGEKIFGLITSGPDRALSWLQGADPGMTSLTDGVSSKVFALIQTAGRGGPRGPGGSGRGPRAGEGGGRISAERGGAFRAGE